MSKCRALLIPVAAIGLVVLAMIAPSRSGSNLPPSRVTVTESAYACPAGSAVTVAAGQIRPGTRTRATVSPDRTRARGLEDPTIWRTSVVDGPGVLVQQRGRGSGAVGFFAGTAPKGNGGGLVVGSCPGVVDDAWLMGLGSGGKHFSTLILTNLADSPAAVDLTLWGPKGEIDAIGSEGIVVEPSSVRRIRLDELAAGESELAMHLVRRRGSLSAVVNDFATGVFRGTEPASATLSPRRVQVVGGVAKGAAGRTLLLLNPGTVTARVDVRVIGPKNTFTPSGLDKIKVPAGSTRSIVVPKSAGSGSQALRLISDHPVSAAVRMSPGTKDYAYAEASLPLAGPAIVPIAVGPKIGVPRLVLTAPGSTAKADVEAFDARMQPLTTSSVTIKGGTTTYFALDAQDAAYFVVRPRGKVIAAATYAKGDGISSLALSSAPVTVLGPQVRPIS
ncbi:DUF5719 family protein [Aeromicrobium sp.]|uniref:DUF5719 family protein n=1 Tax=Aeromicrobium sp. TaxID=1871063 RepID=UPI003C3C5A46